MGTEKFQSVEDHFAAASNGKMVYWKPEASFQSKVADAPFPSNDVKVHFRCFAAAILCGNMFFHSEMHVSKVSKSKSLAQSKRFIVYKLHMQ